MLPEPMRRLYVVIVRNAIDGRADGMREAMVQAGFLTADSSLTAEELQGFWSHVVYEVIVAPQPATYSPDSGTRTARWLFGLDSSNPLSRMTAPDDLAFAPRVQTALSNVCGALHATLPARAIADDMDGIAEPTTELGKLHHAWVRERGLPSALEHHDHP